MYRSCRDRQVCEHQLYGNVWTFLLQVRKMRGRKLLHTLTDEETAIIHALFYQEISEVELAKKLGIARTTLQSRKYKILEKLRKLL